ncbi:MAG: ABC-F family ATP-binding cassette domain-containing protein [Acidimicrobiia bacterium]
MLTARSVSRTNGGALVLDAISLTVAEGQRVGVVGPNGIGKSTLLRILAGIDAADDGRIERVPAATTVGLLPQESDAVAGETLRGYLARRTGVQAASDALDHWTACLAEDVEHTDAYSAALDHFLAVGGGDLDARVGEVVATVGRGADRLDVTMSALSGGQFARAALAAILLSRFDVLLLDEPTNNLDFDGLALLERFVTTTPSAVVVVSHDREFLDRTVERILEIEEETHRGVEYAGGWSEYVERKGLARRQGYARYEEYVAKRDELRTRVQRQRQWSVQGKAKVKRSGETDKFIRHFNTASSEKVAAKARTTERALERLDRVDKPWEGWELRMQLAPTARSGDIVVRLDHAVMQRGSFRLGPVDVEIAWQERVAILGPNGSGKTTLLRALLGIDPLAEGRRWIGPGVTIGTMDQTRDAFAEDRVLLDGFVEASGMDRTEARSLLAKFGLGADDVMRIAGELSPGERSRAELAALMATGVNCLVLDEPTNHLDLAAIEQLEHALESFTGTLLVVSHDRRFLDAVATDRVIELTDTA